MFPVSFRLDYSEHLDKAPNLKPEGSTSPTLSLFFAVSNANILSSLACHPIPSADHPWTAQIPPSLIEHTVATLSISYPDLISSLLSAIVISCADVASMIHSFHQPSHFFFLFCFNLVLKEQSHNQRIQLGPASGPHSVHRTLFFLLLYLSCASRFLFFFFFLLFYSSIDLLVP